ncbi:MAG TPA: ABC transporter ATP-binding protein [Acidimicrobiales bacterium]|jgi:peptide/nickel transport system ATP-binding protein|nr:ABC transporter ATP-binding protein [Acidimicrobiales bacterium]
MNPVLEVTDLRVSFPGGVHALRGVSFSLQRGESLSIVGESGAGKSTLALCLAGLVQPPDATGSVAVAGQEMLGASEETLRSLRWSTIALALQGAPFNPVVAVGTQVAEPLRERLGMSASAAKARAEELADELLLAPAVLDRFPHQISGGERRRAMLAMVLALDPELVVLDEPTAGLDPATKQAMVDQVAKLAAARGFALVVISHDLPDAARLARRTMVLYAGEVMEMGDTSRVVGAPAHPYSWALVNVYPVMTTTKDLRAIRGRPPDPRAVAPGCPFHPRCTQAEPVCTTDHPPLVLSRERLVACHFGGLKVLLAVNQVHKTFGTGDGKVKALQGVSIAVGEGESVGLIGRSGSGKSTLARIISGHLAPDAGDVILQGQSLSVSWRAGARDLRRRAQLVMQDPADALSPRLPVEALVREPLDLAHEGSPQERKKAVAEALDSVGLPPSGSFLEARTHELSGGQLQRVALARALVCHPKVLVADEPTSMLDASEQARMLAVLRERQTEMGLGLVLVSHDMAVVRKVTDRIVVLEAGRVVEEGLSEEVSTRPQSEAAQRLIESAPAFARDEALARSTAAPAGEPTGSVG